MEKTREITESFCDICGEPADIRGFIVAHAGGEVIYESNVIGDYCPEHSEALLLSAVRNCGIAERYDRFGTDAEKEAQKAVERALIGDEYASSVQRCQQLEQVTRDMYRFIDGVLNQNWACALPTDTDNFRDQLETLGVGLDD